MDLEATVTFTITITHHPDLAATTTMTRLTARADTSCAGFSLATRAVMTGCNCVAISMMIIWTEKIRIS